MRTLNEIGRKGEGERISWHLCILTETIHFDKYYYQKIYFLQNINNNSDSLLGTSNLLL